MAEMKTALDNKAQVKAAVDEWFTAARKKDLDGVMKLYSSDARTFGIMPPLAQGGKEQRDVLKKWFDGIESGEDFDYRDTKIAASDSVAFCSGLCCAPVPGEQKGRTMWMRFTVGFEKQGDKWIAMHEHVSVPFNMQTGQASVDLKPQSA